MTTLTFSARAPRRSVLTRLLTMFLAVGLALAVLAPTSAHAANGQNGRAADGQTIADVDATFECEIVTVTSDKDLSNVVLAFSDGTTQRFEGLSGTTATFAGTGDNAGKTIGTAWVKSGANGSGDGPGYGERFDTTTDGECDAPDIIETPTDDDDTSDNNSDDDGQNDDSSDDDAVDGDDEDDTSDDSDEGDDDADDGDSGANNDADDPADTGDDSGASDEGDSDEDSDADDADDADDDSGNSDDEDSGETGSDDGASDDVTPSDNTADEDSSNQTGDEDDADQGDADEDDADQDSSDEDGSDDDSVTDTTDDTATDVGTTGVETDEDVDVDVGAGFDDEVRVLGVVEQRDTPAPSADAASGGDAVVAGESLPNAGVNGLQSLLMGLVLLLLGASMLRRTTPANVIR